MQQLAPQQAEAVERLPAEIVLPALEHGDVDLAAKHGGRDRDVIREQLLLQRLRRRRDDDAAAQGQRGNEIGEALAGARAGFRQEVLAGGERVATAAASSACSGRGSYPAGPARAPSGPNTTSMRPA